MNGLALRLAFASGWGRPALLAGCTALVSGLLLVVAAVLSLPSSPQEPLFGVIADTGTRGGYAFGAVLLTLPPLLLLHQAVRLGTSARERRLAALRLAGATPAEVRRIGAVEVGVPALVGAIGGIGVYWVLRLMLSGQLSYTVREDGYDVAYSLRLVPTSVTPALWQVVLVVVAVSFVGVAVGLLAGRQVTVSPLGVTRRTTPRPPRPWGALLVLAGLALGLVDIVFYTSLPSGPDVVIPLVGVSLLVLGTVSLAPWTAYVLGKSVARRARTAPVLLAARRLAADPRPAGRAAAAVGGIGLVAGGSAALLADVLGMDGGDSSHFAALALVGVCLVGGLLTVVGSLTVHSVESLLDRKRSVASLTAMGSPRDLLVQAQRWEAGLVAIPMASGCVLFGALALGIPLQEMGPWWFVCTLVTLAATVALVWVAVRVAVRLTLPWTVRAADPANLRTE